MHIYVLALLIAVLEDGQGLNHLLDILTHHVVEEKQLLAEFNDPDVENADILLKSKVK